MKVKCHHYGKKESLVSLFSPYHPAALLSYERTGSSLRAEKVQKEKKSDRDDQHSKYPYFVHRNIAIRQAVIHALLFPHPHTD